MGDSNPSRHARQQILAPIGAGGQARIAAGHALVVGCGALGTIASELLVRAGVGRVTIVDRDVVEVSNLQRQTLFDTRDAEAGVPKAEAARRRLGEIDPGVRVDAVVADFTRANAERLVAGEPGAPVDVMVDATDNYETRFLLNDVAVKVGVPLIYGGAVATGGMVATFCAGGPCLRCVFEGVPEPGSQATCETAGVLGSITAMVGARQAAMALRVLVGDVDPEAALERFDAWTGATGRVRLERDPACVCCGMRRFEFLDAAHDEPAAALCGRDAVQIPGGEGGLIDLDALAARLAPVGSFDAGPFVLRGEVEGGKYALTVFADGRTIVHGTRDPSEARSVHARYVGA